MLRSLSIKNYALIDAVDIRFDNALITITGETGAGKSILLGGLSLILGKRADLSILKDSTKKCIVEAEFAIGSYHLKDFFMTHDVDFEERTIIRREIHPEGKSRAFINDTPVTLHVLSSLTKQLIDIHAQHETLQLAEDNFQFKVIDALASNADTLTQYEAKLSIYHQTKKELEKHIALQNEAEKEYDYNSFLLKELQEANLHEGLLETLEATYEKLNNTEEIRAHLSQASKLLGEEQLGVLTILAELKQALAKLSAYGKSFKVLYERVDSTYIELDDAFSEIQQLQEVVDDDPEQLEEVSTKLQQIYNLQKKHNTLTVAALLEKQQQLEAHISVTENLETTIREKQLQVIRLEKELDIIALQLHKNRKKAIPGLTAHLENSLADLGIKNARLKVELHKTQSYLFHGKDQLEFLFSANKGGNYGKLNKVASGGERSRIMLSIKALLSQYTNLPTIIFDEIDTGISGEIALKVGEIMMQMSRYMQVITITHLPQIAAKGDYHFKVYKKETDTHTYTSIKPLDDEERLVEIAQMLGGENTSASALAHAKDLLSSSS